MFLLYVSFNLLDPNPNRLRKPLGRRDDWSSVFGDNSDHVWFGFDTMDDNKNAFSFDDMAAIEKAPLSSLVAFIKASRVEGAFVLFKWIK